MVRSLGEFFERELIIFARGYSEIVGISRGCNPESETTDQSNVPVYYFLLGNNKYNFELSDRITNLDFRLNEVTNQRFELSQFPATPQILKRIFLSWRSSLGKIKSNIYFL